MRRPDRWLRKRIESMAASAIQKFVPYSTAAAGLHAAEPEPPYQRRFDPRWIYNIRRNHSLVNNAIEEKVSQTFRRGFDDWEKEYEAKCPKCKEEFGELTPFEENRPDSVPEGEEVDLESPRECPECGEIADMMTPDADVRDEAQDYFELANTRNQPAGHLQPNPAAGVGQKFIEVCKEVAWDIQSFDDGWMIFERSYNLDRDGRILDYDLENVYRAPPELMEYSFDEDTGHFGGEYWACPKCRSSDSYHPETEPQPCSDCGSKTYEVYAYLTEGPVSGEPVQFFIRGEFAHASEYEPSRYYGYSPVVTLYDEARSVEKMDEWYREAYEQRRAPRGALIIRSSNADATRKWNRGQLEKLNSDSQHVPTLMDDTENGSGDPIKFESLLETPAEMQQMEMRDWIKDRISAKYGVTEIMMSGSPENSGLSQSMEVQVSNRAADRLRRIFNEIYIPAFLGQIGTEGWTREVASVEEEDDMAEAERQQRELQIAQQAAQLGLDVEWTRDDEARVRAGEVEMEDEEGGLGGMLGGAGEGPDAAGDDSPGMGEGQAQLDGAADEGGAPRQESRPQDDEPAFGRMAKDLIEHKEMEVYNEWHGEWEKAELVDKRGDQVIAETETGVKFAIGPEGEVSPV